MTGTLEYYSDNWTVKWSDLHSFAFGTEWIRTPLHPDTDDSELREGETVEFEFYADDGDGLYEPLRYAKLIKPKSMPKIARKTGFINVHIDIETEQMHVSQRPYPTREEAEKGIYIGRGIEKIGCFEIEYTKWPIPEQDEI